MPAGWEVARFPLFLRSNFDSGKPGSMTVKTSSARRNGTEAAAEPIPLRYGDDPYVWACWLYYEDHMTQGDIAEIMGISRAPVNSYLADARARGIVNISVAPS